MDRALMEREAHTEVTSPLTGENIASPRDLRLVAENPNQLAHEQHRLIEWCKGKVADLRAHSEELQSNLESARAHKWKTSTLASAVQRENARVAYYEKMLAALQAGFFIVPNFDAEVFAVRTNRSAPPFKTNDVVTSSRWDQPRLDDLRLPPAQIDEGVYVSPRAEEIREEVAAPSATNKDLIHKFVESGDFITAIDFPFALAKPQVMSATQAAMALCIFDDIAVLPRSQRTNADPMVVGIIRRKEGYNIKRCTFLIAWFLDTETL
jgi:hypothetical protein